jgi:inward rectifier potassium channel
MKKQSTKSQELGFGQRSYSKGTRLITKEGDFNVVKEGMSGWQGRDIYHELIVMTWVKFILLISAVFFIINFIFACLYYWAGPTGIAGLSAQGQLDLFLKAFYFSTQTITTVGFGSLSPQTDYVSLLAALESFLGLLGFALATGLMFARFSRPRRNLHYSSSALIAPYKEGLNGLMFRFINSSQNQLVEAEVDMIVSYWSAKDEVRIFKSVDLERRKINFFSTSWTVVHPINEKSPLWGLTEQDCQENSLEIIVMFKAFDDTYVRQVYDRMSYVADEMKWGEKFIPIYEPSDNEQIRINMEKLSSTKQANLF